jgi:hypothetical protein
MGLIYKEHLARKEIIEKLIIDGIKPTYIEIWECEFTKLKNTAGSSLSEFLKNIEFRENLNPELSLKGGRVETIKTYYECDVLNEEKIYYYDIVSLYPYIQKYKKFPLNHPTIITENFPEIENIFGLIYCRVIPPRKLFIPTLPVKINDKLLFTLCSKCSFLKQASKCEHNDQERIFEDVYTSIEIQQAIKDGYKVEKIFEVWNFTETSQYDPVSKSGGIFTKYINLFLNGKVQASGYPNNVQTEEEKDIFIREFFEAEGVSLIKEEINSNPGIRNVMKLLLNNFW